MPGSNLNHRIIIFLMLLPAFSSIAYPESFRIENIGLSQIENTNQEFTLSKTVFLNLNITDNATKCRYANEDLNYYIWESCTTAKYWLLTSGIGTKTVHVQINHTNGIVTYYNDSIYYDYSGSGLDTTPPSGVTIYAKNFSSNNKSIEASWSESQDNESRILEIDMVYEYLIRLNGVDDNAWTSVTQREIEYSINTTDGDNVTIYIRATNSAGLQSISNHTIMIDQIPPSMPSIAVSVNQTAWHNTPSVTVNWSASDDHQLKGYSYVLSQDNSSAPDSVPEGDMGKTISHTTKTFTTKIDGKYHFKIISLDEAGNPSQERYYSFRIDNTAPKKPIIDQAIQYVSSRSINISWTQTDDLSGIIMYEVQVSNSSDFTSIINSTNTTLRRAALGLSEQGTYHARVRSTNAAGLTSIWSNEEEADFDSTPPVITLISPLDNSANIKNDYPRIILRTDEIATCYNQADGKQFAYTQSRYHETRIRINDGYNLGVICYDLNNNSDSASTTFANIVPSTQLSVSGPASSTQYIDTISKINLSTNPMYGFEKEDINVSLNGSAIIYNLNPTRSSGNYIISFQTPSKTGAYTLTVNGQDISLTVQDVRTTLAYIDTGLTLETSSKKTVYGMTADQMIGIMDETEYGNQLLSNNNNLTLISESSTRKILFYTERISNLKQKESQLESREFFDKEYSTINAYSARPNRKRIIIENPDIEINTTKDFGRGLLNLKIALNSIKNGKKQITIEENRNKAKDQTIYS